MGDLQTQTESKPWEPAPLADVNPMTAPSLTWQQQEQADYQRQQEEDAKPRASSFFDKVMQSSETTMAHNIIMNSIDPDDFEDITPDWNMSDDEIKQWKEGVEERYWDVLEEAVSPSHAQALKVRVLKNQEIDKKVFSDGVGEGIAATLTSAILDPSAIALSVVTEGVMAPVIFSAKAGRVANAFKSGFLAAGTGMAFDGTVAAFDPTVTAEDLTYNAAAYLVLGAALGARKTYDPLELEATQRLTRVADDIKKAHELRDILSSGGQLTEAGKENYRKFLNDDGTPISSEQAAQRIVDELEEVEKTYGAALRIDRASVTGASENSVTRKLAAVLFDDPTQAKDGVKGEIVTIWKRMYNERFQVDYYRNFVPNFKAYLGEQGRSTIGHSYKHADRAKFNEEVTKVLRGGTSESPSVNAMAAEIKRMYKTIGEDLKDPSRGQKKVSGASLLDNPLEDYKMPRIWSPEKVQQAIRTAGGGEAGRLSVAQRIAHAITGVEPERALSIGKHMVKVISKVKHHGQIDVDRVLSARDLGDLRSILKDTYLDEGEIESIASDLFSASKRPRNPDTGKASRLRGRITMNEGVAGISELLENDSERVFMNYINSMSGHIALARKGIRKEGDFTALLNKIDEETQKLLEDPSLSPKKSEKLLKQASRERQILQSAYDHIVGRPLEDDPSGTLSTATRAINKFNYARLMGQMGFTQIPEIGVAATQLGFTRILKYVPSLPWALSRAKKDLAFNEQLTQELGDAIGGWGSSRLLHQVTNKVDEMGSKSSIGDRVVDKAEVALDHAGRLVSDMSGFNIIDSMIKNLALKGQADYFVSLAKKSDRAISKAFQNTLLNSGKSRMGDIGLTEEKFRAMIPYLKKATVSKGRLKAMNFNEWADLDVLNDFQLAMRYWAERNVIQVDYGTKAAMGTGKAWGVEGPIGRMLWQFKSFLIASHSKLLMSGFKYHDVNTLSLFLTTSFLTYLTLNLQNNIKASLMQGEDKDRFLEKVNDPKNMALAVFQRSTWVGLIPSAVDTGAQLTGNDAIFSYRSSGLGADPITATPAYDLIKNGIVPSVGSLTQAALNPDDVYTSSEFNALTKTMLMQNTLVVMAMLNYIKHEMNLPRFENTEY